MITDILILFIIAALAFDYYLHNTRKGRLIDLIPGPPRVPFFGSALEMQGLPEYRWKLLGFVNDIFYPIGKIWVFHVPILSIRHPDDLEAILTSTKHIEKSRLYKLLKPWLNFGLLTSNGAKWHARRKILTPAFHFSILQQFVEILIEEGNRITKSLKDVEDVVVKDLVPFISEHTLNAICETAMGTSLQGLGEFQQQYRDAVHKLGELFLDRIPWLLNDFIFWLSPTGREHKKCLKIVHGFTEKIITERKLYHKNTNDRYLKRFEDNNSMAEINDEEVFGIQKKRLAMLDLLIAASRENHMSDLDIREEVDTFMFEGHDTTAMAICFTLMLLAEHKDIQERVRTEVNNLMEETNGKLSMTSLQRLPYLERCLKESLRLYPSVSFISRVTGEDVKLSSYLVPSGTMLYLNIYGVHRDANLWTNPNVFDPDRFLPENTKNRHLFSYIPFSAGARNCIGQRFALVELKAIIAPLIRNFYLEPVDYLKDMQLKPDMVLRPTHPLRVRFVPIKSM